MNRRDAIKSLPVAALVAVGQSPVSAEVPASIAVLYSTPSASEAVYGFAAWLTCRDDSLMVGVKHDAAIVARLCGEFCRVNCLEDPRDHRPAINHPANDFECGTPSPATPGLTTSEAFNRLAHELNTDESYRQAWVANIAWLLRDLTVPESETTRQLRIELGMTPQRLIDPREIADCNYFAEQLLCRFFLIGNAERTNVRDMVQ